MSRTFCKDRLRISVDTQRVCGYRAAMQVVFRSKGLERAIEQAGGVVKLAEALRITSQAISQWRQVPHERVLAVEEITGVPRHELRPDLYPPEIEGSAA